MKSKWFLLIPVVAMVSSGCNDIREIEDAAASVTSAETCSTSGTPFGGGDGSVSKPYLICSVAQLQNVGTNLTQNFKLMANLDLTGVTFNPIGTWATGYSGIFDGNGKTISNWSYAAANAGDPSGTIEADIGQPPASVHADFATGFFRTLESGAIVKNLTLSNVTVKGRFYTGALVGYQKAGSKVDTCSVTTSGLVADVTTALTGIVIGYNDLPTGGTSGRTGGVVGEAAEDAEITGTSFDGLVRGAMTVGGIVGNGNAMISNSHSSGALNCRDGNCGGIIGNFGEGASGATILSQSYSTMRMVGTNNGGAMGGVLGSTNSINAVVTKCYYQGTITGTFALGGVIGVMSGGSISKSYAVATVNASLAAAGGFAGWIYGSSFVRDSYAVADVTYHANSQWVGGGGAGFVPVFGLGDAPTLTRVYAVGTVTDGTGGLTSFGDLVAETSASSTISKSFALDTLTTNGLAHTSNGTVTASSSETSANMKTSTLYTSAGWDFNTVWQISAGVNNGYPTLR